jgi:GNAT superfamily N-acetyltransferase
VGLAGEKTKFLFEPLGKQHNRAAFSCEEVALEHYLKTQARQDVEKNLAAVFVMSPDGVAVAGYYALSHYVIQSDEIPNEIRARLTRHSEIPATLIGRLARDQSRRGTNAGDMLLSDALKRCLDISRQAASWAVVVDAKTTRAAEFYKKWGFESFTSKPLKLYLPTATIEKLV